MTTHITIEEVADEKLVIYFAWPYYLSPFEVTKIVSWWIIVVGGLKYRRKLLSVPFSFKSIFYALVNIMN